MEKKMILDLITGKMVEHKEFDHVIDDEEIITRSRESMRDKL